MFVVSNSGSAPGKIPLLAGANCLTRTFLRRVSTEVFDCLQPITSRPKETLASMPTPCGMIEKMLHATLKRLVYFECISSYWLHQSVISGNQNVLLTSIGLEWQSLRFGLICPQMIGASGGELKYSLAAVNRRAEWSLCPGVVSATLWGVKYSWSSLDLFIWIKGWLTGFWSHCGGDGIAAR